MRHPSAGTGLGLALQMDQFDPGIEGAAEAEGLEPEAEVGILEVPDHVALVEPAHLLSQGPA